MGIYDSLVLSEKIELEEFPLDVSKSIDSGYRWWQTKDLNSSMDMYAILPSSKISSGKLTKGSDDKFYLCRRHPPVIKWTKVNEGMVLGEDEDVVEDADHWRTIRYTGKLELSEGARDGRIYDVSVKVDRGVLESISMEGMSSPFSDIHPKEPYEPILDLEENIPTISGTDTNVEELANYIYGTASLEEASTKFSLEPEEIALCLRYYNTHQDT